MPILYDEFVDAVVLIKKVLRVTKETAGDKAQVQTFLQLGDDWNELIRES